MKITKILYFAVGLVAAGMLSSCNADEGTELGSVPGVGVYFPTTVPTSYTLVPTTTSVDIPVRRGGVSDAAYSVSILVDWGEMDETAQAAFSVPSSVSFAAGETESVLSVSVDMDAIEEGVDYSFGFLLNDEANLSTFGNSSLYVTMATNPWTSLGMCTYRDDFIPALYTIDPVAYSVEIQESTVTKGLYRLVNPYGEAYPYEVGYDPTSSHYLIVHAEDPEGVYIETCFTGTVLNSQYGSLIVSSYAGLSIAAGEATLEEMKDAGYCGTLENGVITFPTEALLAGETGYNNGELFDANLNGLFAIVLPGYALADNSLSVAYGGMRVASDNTTVTAIFDFTYGADVTDISYAFAAGSLSADDAAALAATIADGTAENVYTVGGVTAGGGEVSVEATLAAAGAYTVVAVPADADGELSLADATYASFYYPGLGAGDMPELNASLVVYTPSDYLNGESSLYPDWSVLFYSLSGTDLTAVYAALTPASYDQFDDATLINAISGDDYSYADVLETINSNGYLGYYPGLNPETEYLMLAYFEDMYGNSALLRAKHTTAADPSASTASAKGVSFAWNGRYDSEFLAPLGKTIPASCKVLK